MRISRAIQGALLAVAAVASRAAAQTTGGDAASTGPDVGVTGFTIVAFAITSFLIAFVIAQRAGSKAPPELDDTLRSVKMLDDLSRNVEVLRGDLVRIGDVPADVARDLDEAERTLDEVTLDIRRSLEKTV